MSWTKPRRTTTEAAVRQFLAADITRTFRVPDRLAGIPTPWYRHLWQRYVTRRP